MVLNEFLVEYALPFLLLFVLVFAILQKSKLLGEGKAQVDSLVSLVIALIFVVVPGPQKEIVISLMPWLAVALAVMLVFFILYGFVAGDLSDMSPQLKMVFAVLAGIFTVVLVFSLTNLERLFLVWFSGVSDGFVTFILFLLVAGAVIWVVLSDKK